MRPSRVDGVCDVNARPDASSISTALPGVGLRALEVADAPVLASVISENVAHLTRHGDYVDLVAMDTDALERMLSRRDVAGFYFGIFSAARLVGVACLVPVDPPRYGCGFWLAEAATGCGVMTESLRALIAHAQDELAATDIFAGVTHGNTASTAVLERLGFARAADFGSYTRFRLDLTGSAP